MRKKWSVILVGLNLVFLAFIGIGVWWLSQRQPAVPPSQEAVFEASPGAKLVFEVKLECVQYQNQKYGFSLCYPVAWSEPEEEEIFPSQQHLYQVILDSGGESYLVDLYDQPAPVSLGNFVRDYFKDTDLPVSWSDTVEINGQPALQFFQPYGANLGVTGIAFGKEKLVLIISTPVVETLDGDFRSVVDDVVLKNLAASFEWAGNSLDKN